MNDSPVSRREFLKIIGGIGAMAGLGTGLGSLLAACERQGVPTNTTATIVAGETTTTTPPTTEPTTTVTTGPKLGRPIRIGVVSARTGRLALFGKADDWWIDLGLAAMPDGILCGDRRLRKVTVLRRDCRSRADVAGEMAEDLISSARVDIIMCAGDGGIVSAVAGRAEALGCPCLCDFVPWRRFVLDRGGTPENPFKWTYAHAIGTEDIVANYLSMWEQLSTNRKIGLIIADDADGRLLADETAGLPPAATAAGYECVLPGLVPASTEDFTAYLEEFEKSGCEICCGALTSPDLVAFWRQAAEQGYRPKIVTVQGALLFPQALETVGTTARNMTAECLWQPSWPYVDSITGLTAQQLAEDYTAKTGQQWTAALAQYSKFEWAVDVFKRADSIIDKRDIIARVATTKLDTCLGPIDFTLRIDALDLSASKRPAHNVYKAPLGGAQWTGGSRFVFDSRLAANANSPELRVAAPIEPLAY